MDKCAQLNQSINESMYQHNKQINNVYPTNQTINYVDCLINQ